MLLGAKPLLLLSGVAECRPAPASHATYKACSKGGGKGAAGAVLGTREKSGQFVLINKHINNQETMVVSRCQSLTYVSIENWVIKGHVLS